MKKLITVIYIIFLASAIQLNAQEVEYSFAVVGCNRVDKGDTNSVTNLSTANVYQLNRTFSEVMLLKPQPKFLFLAGDIVFGYTADSMQLERQLTAWKNLYLAHPIASSAIKLVLIPGNHETQNDKKVATPSAERTWIRVMAPYINGSNGPKPGQILTDSVKTDQSKMTYSFDYGKDHFVMLNTDGTGRDWRLPVGWIAADLASAKAAGARHIFSIGHKPAYEATSAPGDGLIKFKSQRDAFWNSLESNHSEAMFCAHNHCWEKLQPNPGKTFQIIAGNGGSILDASWVSSFVAPKLPYFGFTLVIMMKDGKVISKSYGRDIPDMKKYLQNADNIPTQVKDSTDISWGQVITGKDEKLMNLEKFEVFPNPINNLATLQFIIPSKQIIRIVVFDNKGVEKMVLSNGVMVKGDHELQLNTQSFSSGLYHIQIQGENVYHSASVTVVK